MATKENKRWESRTWPVFKKLCETVPEAGIHFQSEYRKDARHFGRKLTN